MKVIIAGSRDILNRDVVENAIIESGFEITEVVSGGARGVDSIGEWWAREKKIPVKRFAPDWNKHGKAAGPIRNQQMAEYADALIAVWNGSRGTKDMITQAAHRNLRVYIKRV
jgi:hypothetical protein